MKKKFFLFASLLCGALPFYSFGWNGDVLISTPNTSLMLAAYEGEELRFYYYGDRIEEGQTPQIHSSRNALNRPAYPVFGQDLMRMSALEVEHADGGLTLDLIVANVEQSGKDNYSQTKITLKDRVYPFVVNVFYKAYSDSDVIETWTEISHNEKKPVTLKRFDSGCVTFRRGDVWISHLNGAWGAETAVNVERLMPGMKVIKNTDGARNGQASHPEIMFSLDGRPMEDFGRVVGAALCWSGNYKLRIETQDNSVHTFCAGMNNEASEYKLNRKEVFATPKLALTYSDEGIGGASRNFHRWARNGKIHNGRAARDILLNSWEGIGMGINEAEMSQMMESIASMGGELFVMDDGWFGGKYQRSGNSALGDWVVDTRKLPNGIDGLLDCARKNGIKFGIWIEPESVNTISELYEKHPDWALKVKGREPKYGRGGTQLLLDLANPEVQDYIVGLVDSMLTKHPGIAYIKWDANAELRNYGSSYLPKDRQSHIYIDYHRGLENIMRRIRAKYPDIVMQACGGGGGRVGYGIMPYFDEFWISDNTDAFQRIYMQWGTSYFYPSNAMAQHVSADVNSMTKRSSPLKFRFDVAMSGRLGLEVQPKNMSDADKEFAKKTIAEYKLIRDVVQLGNLYRLISPYDEKGVASLMYVSDSKDEAVFFAYKTRHMFNQVIPRFRAAGLDGGASSRGRRVVQEKS